MDDAKKTPERELAESMGVAFDDDGATIPLSKPITVGGAKVSSLRMREGTVADQLAVRGIKEDDLKEIAYFAALCMVAPSDLHPLRDKDYAKLGAALQAFRA